MVDIKKLKKELAKFHAAMRKLNKAWEKLLGIKVTEKKLNRIRKAAKDLDAKISTLYWETLLSDFPVQTKPKPQKPTVRRRAAADLEGYSTFAVAAKEHKKLAKKRKAKKKVVRATVMNGKPVRSKKRS